MSIFVCSECGRRKDSDDCECEVDPRDPMGIELLCLDCAEKIPGNSDRIQKMMDNDPEYQAWLNGVEKSSLNAMIEDYK